MEALTNKITPKIWWLLALPGFALLTYLFWLVFADSGSGIDYLPFFRHYTHLWLHGQAQLYDSTTYNFYNPPWLIWFFVPWDVLPDNVSLALFQAFTVAIIVYGLFVTTQTLEGYSKLWAIVLGLINLHNFDLIYRGEIDGLDLLGIILVLRKPKINPWLLGVAFTLMAIKPPNLAPIALCLLFFYIRDNGWQKGLKSLLVPLGILILSFVIHGWWPERLLESAKQTPPPDTWVTTLWRAAYVLNISQIWPALLSLVILAASVWLWRLTRTDQERLALVVLTTFSITFYALSYHYVIVLVVAYPVIFGWRMWVGIALYLLTYLPLVRLEIGAWYAFIDITFVLGLYIALAVKLISQTRVAAGPELVISGKTTANSSNFSQS